MSTEPVLLDESSPRAKLFSIGDELHNLSCSLQGDTEKYHLMEMLGRLSRECWTLAEIAPAMRSPGIEVQP